jgi:DNA-binding winged helix-turn-helix (wHTH) protein
VDMILASVDQQRGEEKPFPTQYLRFNQFHLDLQRQELSKNGVRIPLAGKMYVVLTALLETPGEIVTRDTLRDRLWPEELLPTYESNINTTVNKLRKTLGDCGRASSLIETVPRKGYTLIAKVQYVDQAATISPSTAKNRPSPGDGPQNSSHSILVGALPGRVWFAAGIIALVVAAMLLGAAITFYLHRLS